MGNQTRKALDYLKHHPDALSLPDDPGAQGNGAVMRAAPHGMMSSSPEEAFGNAFAEAALTHPSPEARISAALVACLVAHLVEGAPPRDALESAYASAEGAGDLDTRHVLAPAEGYRYSPKGWTVYTTRLALRALLGDQPHRLPRSGQGGGRGRSLPDVRGATALGITGDPLRRRARRLGEAGGPSRGCRGAHQGGARRRGT
ncbi:MAG: hypothetical protein CYG60_13365 [Actinobacteria bacterium]|nr:MAG: hypothetical protein CYG60_13365 [Actinomycetota bacterium]